jgi:hypothetical protein
VGEIPNALRIQALSVLWKVARAVSTEARLLLPVITQPASQPAMNPTTVHAMNAILNPIAHQIGLHDPSAEAASSKCSLSPQTLLRTGVTASKSQTSSPFEDAGTVKTNRLKPFPVLQGLGS